MLRCIVCEKNLPPSMSLVVVHIFIYFVFIWALNRSDNQLSSFLLFLRYVFWFTALQWVIFSFLILAPLLLYFNIFVYIVWINTLLNSFKISIFKAIASYLSLSSNHDLNSHLVILRECLSLYWFGYGDQLTRQSYIVTFLHPIFFDRMSHCPLFSNNRCE